MTIIDFFMLLFAVMALALLLPYLGRKAGKLARYIVPRNVRKFLD
jgi:hypothetical protein